jgi:hypothetical protein
VQVGEDEVVTCVYTNTRKTGSIELKKVWEGTAGETTLKIGATVGGDEVVSKTVTTDDTTGAQTVDTGAYCVSETDLPDHNTELHCYNESGAEVVLGANNNLTVGDGETVTCVYTNTRKTGSLTVVKDVDPDDPGTEWAIAVTGPTSFNDILTGDDDTGAKTVDTGSYTIVETGSGPTELDHYDASYACSDGTSGDGASVTVDVGENDDVICTFTNTRKTFLLSLEKTLDSNADEDGSGDVSVDDTLTYSFVATNIGNQTLTTVTIVDPLPGLSDLVCAPGQPATLDPSDTLECTATYVVTQADIEAGEIHNTATADSDQADPVDDPETILITMPVGGATLPLSLAAVLAPWLALAALLLLAGGVVVWKPRTR